MTATAREFAKAVVLGGAGFIGTHLVRELISQGIDVTSIDRDPRERLKGSGAKTVQADLSLGDRVLGETLQDEDVEVLFIAAGTGLVPRSLENPEADLVNNVVPSLAVLEALRQRTTLPVVVYLSSVAVYGDARKPEMGEDHPLDPASPYGVSKAAAERYLRLYHLLYAIPTLTLRLFSVFGPGQRKLVVHDLFARLLAGEDPLIVGGIPEITRDYVYVADVARCAHRLSTVAPAQGEAYNVCTGRGTSLESLLDRIQAAASTSASVRFTGQIRSGDPVRFVGDPRKASALGAVCGTPLDEGLQETFSWLSDQSIGRS